MPLEVIAEWGQGHGGNVTTAIKQARATRDIGAQVAKWQIFEPTRLVSRDATRYWDGGLGGHESQLDTFTSNGMLTATEWRRVAKECAKVGVEFCATPFDLEAVDLLESIGVRSYKLASGDITYRQLVERIALTGKRCLLSTGASTLSEVEQAVNWFEWASSRRRAKGGPGKAPGEMVLLACDLQYPTTHPNLGKIRWLADYGRKVGYSDHTLSVDTGRLAAISGATVLEKHVTLNPDGAIPDDKMALTIDQMRTYIKLARWGHAAGSDLVLLGEHETAAREGARRSIYTTRDMRQGEALTVNDMAFLRPCPKDGLQPFEAERIVGHTLNAALSAGERVTLQHLTSREDSPDQKDRAA